MKEKQVEALKTLKLYTQQLSVKGEIPEDYLSEEAKNEIEKIKEIQKMENTENLI